MERTTLKAFHDDLSVKEKYLDRVRLHAFADEIENGKYWEGGRGCAVGCTIHSDQHSAYETELGLPTWLARLEDQLFEGMPLENAKAFPVRFLEAIPVGANLDIVKAKFFHWLLVDETEGVIRHAKKESTRKIIADLASLYQLVISGEPVSKEQWQEARSGDAAAYAYVYADAAWVAADACADADADAARYVARQQSFYRQSEKLLQLLSEA